MWKKMGKIAASSATRALQVKPGDTSLIFDLSSYNALVKKVEDAKKPGIIG